MRDQWRKSNAEHQACLIYAETKPIDAERLCDTSRCSFVRGKQRYFNQCIMHNCVRYRKGVLRT